MKRLTWCAGWALLGAAALWAAPPAGDAPKDDAPKGDAPKAVSDEEFVKTASAAGLAEVNFGRLAAEQASRADVKKFAQQMVDDHSKGNEELDKAADKHRITPAPQMDEKHAELFRKLTALKGAEFDREYVDSQLADHKEAVALFEAESKNGKNEDLKALAGKLLPTLKHHLDMVEGLAGAEKAADKDKTAVKDKAAEKDKGPAPADKDKAAVHDKDKTAVHDKDKGPGVGDKDKALDKDKGPAHEEKDKGPASGDKDKAADKDKAPDKDKDLKPADKDKGAGNPPDKDKKTDKDKDEDKDK